MDHIVSLDEQHLRHLLTYVSLKQGAPIPRDARPCQA
jgi:hypothetical protein